MHDDMGKPDLVLVGAPMRNWISGGLDCNSIPVHGNAHQRTIWSAMKLVSATDMTDRTKVRDAYGRILQVSYLHADGR